MKPCHISRRNFLRQATFATCCLLCVVSAWAQGGKPRVPVPIIFDTDMGGDCDDVGALFILHGAAERGEAKLLATIGCVSADAIAPALDAISIWFGRPEIPVGTLRDSWFLAGPHYTTEMARRFPHQFATGKDYPDAVALYRQILSKRIRWQRGHRGSRSIAKSGELAEVHPGQNKPTGWSIARRGEGQAARGHGRKLSTQCEQERR